VTAAIVAVHICIAHVGDSRAYRIRDGAITQLTRDHSLFEDYKEANPEMRPEDLENFPHKNVITRALGLRESVDVEIRTHQLREGDLYVLCTDGLSGLVTDEEILRIVRDPPNLERAVAELVDRANRNGGNDNITTVLVQCTSATA
jgi:serine/threonine protein phosphatase PrpC